MKKLALLFSLLLAISAQAQRSALAVNESMARQTAQAFADSKLNTKGDAVSLASARGIYIYNIGDHGFVIVSGNTVLPPILGYSDHEAFPSMEDAPENFTAWIQHYSEMIDFAIENGVLPEPEIEQQWDEALKGQFPSKGMSTVTPLITTHWNQDCYYNEYCPSTGGGWWGGPCGHVYAGCVACAMAQVMKYWNHPEIGFGSHSYVHGTYGEQTANFAATTYHWDNMPEQIYSHNDAVATLMYHCGVSVNMNYAPDGSGAQSKDVETALRSYFGYCGSKYREKNKYDNNVWIAMLKSELDLSHPIYYSGSSGSAGHAFVCDGYDSNDLFHFNFGWSGSGDDYYSLYDVNGYNSSQAAVMNIVPMDIRADDNGIIYVSADGEGNGSSWSNATSKLEYASCLSSGGNIRVWVKKGTYYGDETDPENAFSITPSNMVYGGFNGDEGPDFSLNDRDLDNNRTILDGQGAKRVLNQSDFFSSGTRAVWDGFVIQNGLAGAGAGVYLNDYVTISHCLIHNNVSNGFGGGVYINSSTGTSQTTLNNCIITGNTASMGGGVCDRNSSIIINCRISNNTATTKGGGIYLYNTDKPILRGCVVSNNTAANAGGIYARGRCQLNNCNIVMNEASDTYGGIYIEDRNSKYTSCIIWGNVANDEASQIYGNATFEYCAIQGGMPGECNINLPAENDGEEPGVFVRFVRPAEGVGAEFTDADWNILPTSICLNAGKPGTAGYPFDIAGNQRLQHGILEIGAYELNVAFTPIEDYLVEGEPYSFNGRLLYEPGYYTTVYPMPTCDSVVGLTLSIGAGIPAFIESQEVLHVEIFSILGQRMGQVGRLDAIDNLSLSPGCYILRVHTTEGILSKKVIIK
ncbi:MAG: C10 family peptidase [Bacteroidales bacterium]|nr:C10 family peptidase [Bacteroidales bacterium]